MKHISYIEVKYIKKDNNNKTLKMSLERNGTQPIQFESRPKFLKNQESEENKS